MFTTNFDKYACINDAITCTIGEFEFTATIRHDDYSKPDDCDCYSREDITRWKNGEWSFCGIVVTVEYDGIKLDCSDSLWGVELNILDSNDYLTEVANDCLSQMNYESALQKMRDTLS